jgi:hypothetical protein
MIFRRVFCLETSTGPVGGNIVLNCVKGVGKTTILIVSGVLAACLTKHLVPLYWIFEKSTRDLQYISIYCLFKAARDLFSRKSLDGIDSFDDLVLSYDDKPEHCPCVKMLCLFDEFTTLYSIAEAEFSKRSMTLMKPVARDGDVLFVMAASRFNVHKYIYPSISGPWGTYPDLNNGLFAVKSVRPIRNILEFIKYWNTCFTDNISVDEVEKNLKLTGGVGRLISNLKKYGDVHHNANMDYFRSNRKAYHFALDLLEKDIPVADERIDVDVELLDQYCDEYAIYNDGSNFTFLFESVRDMLLEELEKSEDLKMMHVFRMQRIGFVDGSSGHSNEKLLFKYLPRQFKLNAHVRSLTLHGAEKGTAIQNSITQIPSISNDKSVEEKHRFLTDHSKCLIKWSVGGHETGIDRL